MSPSTHTTRGENWFRREKKKLLFQRKKIEPKRASERQKKKLRIGNYFYNLSDGNKGKERVSGRQHEICAPLSTFVSVWLARFRHRNHGELLPRLSLSVSPGFRAILSSFRSSKLSVRVGENPRKSLHDRIQIHHDGWRFPLTNTAEHNNSRFNGIQLSSPRRLQRLMSLDTRVAGNISSRALSAGVWGQKVRRFDWYITFLRRNSSAKIPTTTFAM